MKKILLSATLASLLALSGCDTFINRDKPVEPVEPTEEVVIEDSTTVDAVTPTEDTTVEGQEDVVVEEDVEEIVKPSVDTVEVSAKQLGRDYHIDKIRADNLYKDKALTVSGVVDNVFISSGSDKAMVFLETEDKNITILAGGDAAFATRAKDLKVKDKVTVLCEGAGSETQAPVLEKCTVQ